jgi:hypothetical protein
MRGEGPYARLIEQLFATARRRLGLASDREPLRTDLFKPPDPASGQLRLL